MIKTLLNPLFLVAVFLATANQVIERSGVHIPFVHSYLDDVLVFPIVLTVGLSFYRILWKEYTLTPWHIWPLLAVYIFVFEIWMPTTSSLYTADIFDVVAYVLGILIFQRFINTEVESPAII